MKKSEPNIHTICLWGNKPPQCLLHMVRTEAERKAEIKDQESHIMHLINRGRANGVKADTSKEESVLESLKETLPIFAKGLLREMKIWSKSEIKIGDKIVLPHAAREFDVVEIIKRTNHSGRFNKIKDSENTFYILSGHYYNPNPVLEAVKNA